MNLNEDFFFLFNVDSHTSLKDILIWTFFTVFVSEQPASEEWERRRKEKERGMSGPIVPRFRVDHRRGNIQLLHRLFPLFPAPLSPALKKLFSFFFFFRMSPLFSYSYWHPLTLWAPSVPLNPITPSFILFFLVKHHPGIYTSEQTTPQKPSCNLLQAALQLFSGLRCLSPSVTQRKSLKSQTHMGTHKELERKEMETVWLSFWGEKGGKGGGGQFRKNFGVYSKESSVPILKPTLAWQLHFMAPWKNLHQPWNLASDSSKQSSVSYQDL